MATNISNRTDGELINDTIWNTDLVANINSNNKRFPGLVVANSDIAVVVADGISGIPIPVELNGFDITDVIATVHDKGITDTTDVQIRRRRAGSDVDVLSTKVTIGDEYFASDGVINTSNDDLATGDILYIDVDAIHSGTAPNGLSVIITVNVP
jgi:hypothetical protein